MIHTRNLRAKRLGAAKRQRGVGMIEVLIAVLVLSIAFLGVAALQAVSLSSTNEAMARSMATIASYSIMDAMRADLANAKAGNYNTSSALTADACPAVPSSGATLANAQINQWCSQLATAFGNVSTTKGSITCDGNGNCTITVSFVGNRKGVDGGTSQTVTTQGIL